jgi:uncharacterized pyridoxamine 5'-phosphate oxidase family protein
MNLETIWKYYFKSDVTAYLATVEEDQPRVRPMSLISHDDNLYHATMTTYEKVKQIQKNKKIELVISVKTDNRIDPIRAVGRAKIIDDTKTKKDVSTAISWFKFFWNSPDDPAYTLFQLDLEKIFFNNPDDGKKYTIELEGSGSQRRATQVTKHDDWQISSRWLARFSGYLKETAGKEIHDEVIKNIDELKSTASNQEVIDWTIASIDRFDKSVDEDKKHDILTACACQYPKEKLENLQKLYTETKNLTFVHSKLQEQFLADIKENKQLEDEHIKYIVDNNLGVAGTLTDNIIIASKIPKEFQKYLAATDPIEKKYFFCHCPRVRDAIKTSTKISKTYCLCGAGFYRGIWEFILQQPVRVKVLESVLNGDDMCKIEIQL